MKLTCLVLLLVVTCGCDLVSAGGLRHLLQAVPNDFCYGLFGGSAPGKRFCAVAALRAVRERSLFRAWRACIWQWKFADF